jgi:TonB family protein
VQVSATKTISALTARALFLVGLFLFVIVMQIAVVTALRGLDVNGGPALLISGAVILATMFVATTLTNRAARRAAARTQEQRIALGLPDGACCIVWRTQKGEADFPWELEGDVRAAYPPLARRLGIEGYAVVDFEVGADGAAKNLHCREVWPAQVFYESAAEALRAARFRLRPGAAARFGPSYRIPFVFRIRGAAKVSDRGHSALGPVGYAAKKVAAAMARGTWRGLVFTGVLLMVLLREFLVFARWLLSAVGKIAGHLRNLKRI